VKLPLRVAGLDVPEVAADVFAAAGLEGPARQSAATIIPATLTRS
jgi:hypothetical protein